MEALQDLMKRISPNGEVLASSSESPEESQKRLCQLKCEAYNSAVGDLNLKDGYDCPKCKNKGFLAEPAKSEFGYWYELNVYCECQKIRRTIRRLERSGLKNIIKDYTFKNYKAETDWQKAIKDAAIRFVQDNEHTWFFIGGASGAGKTHICTAISGYYLNHGKEVKYMLWRDEVVKLKANVNDSEVYEKQMHDLKTAEVLYIDDLFKTGKDSKGEIQRPTVGDVNIAFELLNYRYNNSNLITIISSECRGTDILNIDEAVGGRIAEMTSPYGYGINIKPDRAKNYRLRGSVEL